MDVVYIVESPKATANVRALAFQDGERSFYNVVRPKTFVNDANGKPTAGNVGDGVPANVQLNLAWKVPSDWDVDTAKVKFEILTSEVAQLPLKTEMIPATAKNPALTIAYNSQTDADIFNAFLWHWANGAADLHNNNGYVVIDLVHPYRPFTTFGVINHATIGNRPVALRYLYRKMGWEPLEGGNLMNYVRQTMRKDLWFNSGIQTCAIKTSTKPAKLYIGEKAYCVIDVSKGPTAASYPVEYLDAEPVNGWSDEYKTSKILLRRCEAGKFLMAKSKDVTFTKPFYIGVFLITQKQYEQVMGTSPTTGDRSDMHSVQYISWNTIRGDSKVYDWPTVKAVDPATFVGKIQAKTGLQFDLPTEAQWEYACRAGTSSPYGNGGVDAWNNHTVHGYDYDLQLMESLATSDVGLQLPNFWGLFDVHGSVGQWCLDYYEGFNRDPAIDYEGADNVSSYSRVIRGIHDCQLHRCFAPTSFARSRDDPRATSDDDYGFVPYGFRLSWHMAE